MKLPLHLLVLGLLLVVVATFDFFNRLYVPSSSEGSEADFPVPVQWVRPGEGGQLVYWLEPKKAGATSVSDPQQQANKLLAAMGNNATRIGDKALLLRGVFLLPDIVAYIEVLDLKTADQQIKKLKQGESLEGYKLSQVSLEKITLAKDNNELTLKLFDRDQHDKS